MEYVLKNDSLVSGVIDILKDGSLKIGFFSATDENIMLFDIDGRLNICMNSKILNNDQYYRERLEDSCFHHINNLEAIYFNMISKPARGYKNSLPYDSSNVLTEYVRNYENLEIPISDVVKRFAPVVRNFSFGLEFETTRGRLSDAIVKKTGLIPLRDGSISGIEYVTVPLRGEKGLQTIIEAVTELNKRTVFDDSCSMHLHIGNVPRTKEFILAFVKTTLAIQEEIYTMFPLYKKYNFKVKNKNYSKPYPTFDLLSRLDSKIDASNIDKNFNIIYEHLSMGEPFRNVGYNLENVKNHPADREGRQKWNVATRYYIHNLIPLIFGNKQTIEFRIHTPTSDINKVMSFVMMNTLIVNYVVRNTAAILNNSFIFEERNHSKLEGIIDIELSKIPNFDGRQSLRSELFDYFGKRRAYSEMQKESGNIVGIENEIVSRKYINWNAKNNIPMDIDNTIRTTMSTYGKITEEDIRDMMKGIEEFGRGEKPGVGDEYINIKGL